MKKTKKRAARTAAAGDETVLVLRSCNADMTSYNGFKWPAAGPVECADWKPAAECGNGLHGLLWGAGDGSLCNWAGDAKWLVVEVLARDVVDLGQKVKFPRGTVIYCGDLPGAAKLVATRAPAGTPITGGSATAGYRGSATAGYRGSATAGDRGSATAGDRGSATAGDSGSATAGYRGSATAGDRGSATAGDSGSATAGDRGSATAGDSGSATAGDRGSATAGDSGSATAGDRGSATAGDSGKARAGKYGAIVVTWWDSKKCVYRKAVAEVDGETIRAGVFYEVEIVDGAQTGKLVEAKDQAPVKCGPGA